MKGVGGILALAGLLSIVLHFIGYNLRILVWIDGWGTTAGWGIRIGLIVVGAALFLIGSRGSGPAPAGADRGGGDDD